MPIAKKWSKMNREKIKKEVPATGGAYELTSFGQKRALYIGSSGNLRRRLIEHLDDKNPNRFRYKTAGFLQSPEGLEQDAFGIYEEKYGQIPPWNSQDPQARRV